MFLIPDEHTISMPALFVLSSRMVQSHSSLMLFQMSKVMILSGSYLECFIYKLLTKKMKHNYKVFCAMNNYISALLEEGRKQ